MQIENFMSSPFRGRNFKLMFFLSEFLSVSIPRINGEQKRNARIELVYQEELSL